jgi:phosphoribosylamine--glycine ligase
VRALVIGSGGREHALAVALWSSPSVTEVVCAPGNPGMERVGRCVAVEPGDPGAVAALADDLGADVTVIGPEEPLVEGAADAVRQRGRPCLGPGSDGARLEGSKAWMKEVLADAGVPTARHASFTTGEEDRALAYLDTLPGLYVVKTDGLAAGKGVVVTDSLTEARDAVRRYLSGAAFGDAGRTLVIEEGLTGPELSLLVLCAGEPDGAVPLAPAQDFKRVGDGDVGPNTGGMGAYSPVPFVGVDIVDEVLERAVQPTLHALVCRGIEYRGVLYAGLMLTPDGPKILEYNVRFGDPEAQVVLPRLTSDFGLVCLDAASGRAPEVRFGTNACVTVVLATAGYPTSPRKGDLVEGISDAESLPGVTVFHAGTSARDGALVTAGGRVLDVTALAPSLPEARDRAYEAAARITWPGLHYRRDIAATAAAVPAYTEEEGAP